jgi:hypothetical protein
VVLHCEFAKTGVADWLRVSARSTDRVDGWGRLAAAPLAYLHLGMMAATWAHCPLMRLALTHTELAGATLGFAGLIVFMNPALVDWIDFVSREICSCCSPRSVVPPTARRSQKSDRHGRSRWWYL